ncbi:MULTISPECIES: alpha/beta fold hydrolase [Streptomyces]|nr:MULTISPECIES: alpha/beta hydrolase [Streptomyces]KOU15429.1 alpha/beta hydrolase [Streptomyces sp. WM6349]KOU99803.1 alpha/beta hydrolase [Streptomyces sp. XY533]KOV42300.1 alpha/beta hydrolase [Streptomyces sp. H036]MBP2342352.1 pimeloyl-ACP methyl ester carboxylesterase [Streptomyces virginiae]
MPTFSAYDGTELAYRALGEGPPLVCLPGGAMRASRYLGDLGGLAAGRTLILLDLRGTGDSAVPADESTYRADHQVADVEALRAHLGLERMDLLAHSAAGNLALLYAAAHPQRLGRTVLVTPTAWVLDLASTAEHRLAAARLRAGTEPYDTALEAYGRILGGADTDEDWDRAAPLFYGRWDGTAQAHYAAGEHEQNEKAAAAFVGPGACDPPATRAALRRLTGEVLVLAGELDGNPPPGLAERIAAALPAGLLDVQPAAAHFPWLDDPARFAGRVERFLTTGA